MRSIDFMRLKNLTNQKRSWMTKKDTFHPFLPILEMNPYNDTSLENARENVCNVSRLDRFKTYNNAYVKFLAKEGVFDTLRWSLWTMRATATNGRMILDNDNESTQNLASEYSRVLICRGPNRLDLNYVNSKRKLLKVYRNSSPLCYYARSGDVGKFMEKYNDRKSFSPSNLEVCLGMNVLHHAVMSENLKMVKLVAGLMDDIDVNCQDSYGWTPLHFASMVGSIASINYLLEMGANKLALTHQGHTPFDVRNGPKADTIAGLLAPK